jgi:hypothetical protein
MNELGASHHTYYRRPLTSLEVVLGASGDETDTEFPDQPGDKSTNPAASQQEISSRVAAAPKRLKAAGKRLDEVAASDSELAAKTLERYTRQRRSDAEDPADREFGQLY